MSARENVDEESNEQTVDEESTEQTVDEESTEQTVEAAEAAESVTDDAGESDESDASDESGDQYPPLPPKPSRPSDWVRRRWAALLAAALVVVSAGAAGGVYWWVYRPDRLTGDAAQQQVLTAAREGTEAILTYAPDTLDKDLANAKSRLTGDFLDHYNQFTEQIVAPAARQKGIKTEANVARAAVSRMTPQTAEVLVFVNQVTTSTERPTPALSTSSVEVILIRQQDRWLISEFNPI